MGYELCVMVIDCDKAKDYLWKIKKLRSNTNSHQYHGNLIASSKLVQEIDKRWNCLDGEDLSISEIYQLHLQICLLNLGSLNGTKARELHQEPILLIYITLIKIRL